MSTLDKLDNESVLKVVGVIINLNCYVRVWALLAENLFPDELKASSKFISRNDRFIDDA